MDLLKAVHGSGDIFQTINACKDIVGGRAKNGLDGIVNNLNHWDKIGQMDRVLEVRKELIRELETKSLELFREIVYLDMALENYTRQLCEEIFHVEIDLVYLFKELVILLENVKFTCRSSELDAVVADFLFFYQSL